MRDVDKYKGKGVFKVNEGTKFKVEGQTNFVTRFREKNSEAFLVQ